MDNHFVDRLFPKWPIYAFIISGTLNIGLIAVLITLVVKDNTITIFERSANVLLQESPKRPLPTSISQVLDEYLLASYENLVQELQNEEYIEEGYCRRDLALACLSAFHHFDIERALTGHNFEKRSFSGGLILFPGLKAAHWQSIHHFISIEVWPLTPEGLFDKLKKGESSPALKEAFALSQPFYVIKRFLPFANDELIELLLAGEWNMIASIAEEVERKPTVERSFIDEFLFSYFSLGSKLAAHFLFFIDQDFLLKRLSDEELLMFLKTLDSSVPHIETFCQKIFSGPRSNQVREYAAKIIGKSTPAPCNHELSYIVEYGDTLWKISRRFKVNIEEIVKANHLDSAHCIQPGQRLLIPVKEPDRSHQGARGHI